MVCCYDHAENVEPIKAWTQSGRTVIPYLFLNYTSPMKRKHPPPPQTCTFRIRLEVATALWTPNPAVANNVEKAQAISGRTFQTNQASTPADCLTLYVARLTTITVDGGFATSHCAREGKGPKKLRQSLSTQACPQPLIWMLRACTP